MRLFVLFYMTASALVFVVCDHTVYKVYGIEELVACFNQNALTFAYSEYRHPKQKYFIDFSYLRVKFAL